MLSSVMETRKRKFSKDTWENMNYILCSFWFIFRTLQIWILGNEIISPIQGEPWLFLLLKAESLCSSDYCERIIRKLIVCASWCCFLRLQLPGHCWNVPNTCFSPWLMMGVITRTRVPRVAHLVAPMDTQVLLLIGVRHCWSPDSTHSTWFQPSLICSDPFILTIFELKTRFYLL